MKNLNFKANFSYNTKGSKYTYFGEITLDLDLATYKHIVLQYNGQTT